jgi:uncharacterized protein (TIGR00369 family)
MQPVISDDPRQVFSKVPFMQALGVEREFSQAGKARLSLEPKPEHGNVIGAVHGGIVVTLLDVVMASAAVSAVDFVKTVVTLNLDTCFVEPGRGKLYADGEVVARDDALVWCQARVSDGQGRLVAKAQASFRYLPRPGLPAAASSSQT